MKSLLTLSMSLLVLAPAAQAQNPHSNQSLQSLVETERAFSRTSEERDMRQAFLAFIADDGILFRPTAQNGKQWLTTNPLPQSEKHPLLAWKPIFAEVSLAGDLGYTTGPWLYKADIKDEKASAYGNFVTIWKKQADGSWKFALDLGITHSAPTSSITEWQPAPDRKRKVSGTVPQIDSEKEQLALMNYDREFSNAASTNSSVKTFLSHSDNDVRVYRDNNFPYVGKSAAEAALSNLKHLWSWQPGGAGVSTSGDLGYTYGVYELRTNDAAKVLNEKGNYLRIWKRHGNKWKVVLDVANPLPKEKKTE